MTVIFGTLKDVGGQLAQGTVTVSSLVTRPAHGSASTVITKERHVLPLRNGAFESPDLDPGPVLVEATTGGAFDSWQVTLPEDGRHDLATLIEMHVEYPPSVVGRVEAAAADANRAAQAAGQAATRAGEVEQRVIVVESRIDGIVADGAAAVRAELQSEIAGVDQARVDALAAQAAAEDAAASAAADARAEVDPLIAEAAGHAADAEESAHQSQASADAARVDADRAAATVSTAAGQLRQEVQAHVTAATAAEVNAAGSAAAAKNSADDAADSASSAAASAVEAGDVKVLVDTAAEQAAGSAVQAAGFADAAAGSATSAASAKSAAEVARDEAVQAAESAQTSAPADGWPRTSLSSDVRDSLTRADTALTSVPRATTSTPGGVQLAGDLGGTWDAPTVPGLASKMDAQPVSDAATSSTLVKRTSGATIKTARPQADDDAATKKYVDDGLALKIASADATPNNTPGTVALRGPQGQIDVGLEPPLNTSATPKAYVDGKVTSLTVAIDQRATTAYVDGAVSAEQTRITALESSRATVAQMQARPAMWLWDGTGTWSPPAGAVSTDNVLNLATGDIHSIQEVV